MKVYAILLVLFLAACSTADVQQNCADTQKILQLAQPFIAVAPIEVRAAVTAVSMGTVACGMPEYAAAREQIITWLRSKGAAI